MGSRNEAGAPISIRQAFGNESAIVLLDGALQAARLDGFLGPIFAVITNPIVFPGWWMLPDTIPYFGIGGLRSRLPGCRSMRECTGCPCALPASSWMEALFRHNSANIKPHAHCSGRRLPLLIHRTKLHVAVDEGTVYTSPIAS